MNINVIRRVFRQILPQNSLTRACVDWLRECGESFALFDVGCSGGLDPAWEPWRSVIVAHGFDPSVDEIERLRATNTDCRLHYHDGWIGCENQAAILASIDGSKFRTNTFELSSAKRAATLTQGAPGSAPRLSAKRFSIDQFCRDQNIERVDFIKTDTDGSDLYALIGAKETLSNRGVLGLSVECDFHGPADDNTNCFANIDRLLRSHGFTLIDLVVRRYTRAALPGTFTKPFLAQTKEGPVFWADATYMLEPCINTMTLRAAAYVKLLALYETLGFPDCAAQLLLHLEAEKRVPAGLHSWELLDRLATEHRRQSYRDLTKAFDRDPTSFYRR